MKIKTTSMKVGDIIPAKIRVYQDYVDATVLKIFKDGRIKLGWYDKSYNATQRAELRELNIYPNEDGLVFTVCLKPKQLFINYQLNSYLVCRPNCTPSLLAVAATSKKEAVELAHTQHGYVINTTAELITEPRIILSKS
jgi:hypothetical protein